MDWILRKQLDSLFSSDFLFKTQGNRSVFQSNKTTVVPRPNLQRQKIYLLHVLKVFGGLLCELRFIRQCFCYYRLISWYHEEGRKTANRIKNLWRFLRAATPCQRTCISAQVLCLRKFHKVESNKLLSDNDFLPKTFFRYPFHF